MDDSTPSTQNAREQALLAMALRPDDARTRFLVALRRARGAASGRVPLFVNLRHRKTLDAHAVGGWWFAGSAGSWTDGPMAQLLVVPNDVPRGNAVVEFDIAGALVGPSHPTQTVTTDVNGAAESRWIFSHGQPWEPRRYLVIPAAAFERMGGFLVTLRIHAPQTLQPLDARQGIRSIGIALRGITIWAPADGGASG